MKFKSIAADEKRVIKDFRILAIGNEKEHAELRMLGFLLSKSQILKKQGALKSATYIGISKLCCPDCICAIQTINRVIELKNIADQKGFPEVKAVFDSDRIEENDGEIGAAPSYDVIEKSISNEIAELFAAEEAEAEASEVIQLAVTGSHDITTPKWSTPAFLCGEAFLPNDNYLEWSVSRSLASPLATDAGWEKIKLEDLTPLDRESLVQIKKVYSEAHDRMKELKDKVSRSAQSMYPSPSSSDAAGSSPVSSEEKPHVKVGIFDELVQEEKGADEIFGKIL